MMLIVSVSYFQLLAVSDAIYKRKIKFLTKLNQSENTICKLCEKNIIELAVVHEHFVSLVMVKLFQLLH